MESAFGIDHGEISKAVPRFRRPMRGMPGGRRPSAAQRRTQGTGVVASNKKRITGKLNQIGEADVSLKGIGAGAGRATRGVGNFMANRPGLTGTALVGGGGAAGYKYLKKDKEPKR